MKKQLLTLIAIQSALAIFNQTVFAQASTTAPTEAEKEAFYATTIENRTVDILKLLNFTDAAKSNAVHEILVAQYHELRVRDAADRKSTRLNSSHHRLSRMPSSA